MPKPLSPAQERVLARMKEGWALCGSGAIDGGYWLQQRGCGMGGERESVNANTFLALFQRDLIYRPKYSFPTSTYELTAAGKAV